MVAAATPSGTQHAKLPASDGTTRAIGEALMSGYVLPFEMVSLVLLAALVGAAFLARRTPGSPAANPPAPVAPTAPAAPAPAPANPPGGHA
jgi:NADH-quinone oxidoreductase subunit J